MDALDNIFSRVSVRAYTDKRISEDAIHTILQAAMSGPSCVNSRDWSFIVVQNRETLRKMAAGGTITAICSMLCWFSSIPAARLTAVKLSRSS